MKEEDYHCPIVPWLEEDNRVELSPFAEWNNFPSCLVPGTSIFHDWCNLQGSNLVHRLFRPALWPHQLKLLGRGDEIRTHDDDFKDRCLRPLGDTPTNLVEAVGFEPTCFLGIRFTVWRFQPLTHTSIIVNALLRMRVLKHSSWMNPLALRPENALIRCDFSLHKRSFIPQAARLSVFFNVLRRDLVSLLHKMKNPGVFSSRVLLGYLDTCYSIWLLKDPWAPGNVFTRP